MLLLLVLGLSTGIGVWALSGHHVDENEEIQRIRGLIAHRDFSQAEHQALTAAKQFPNRPEFNWLAAFSGFHLQNYEDAFLRTNSIPQEVPFRIEVDRLRAELADNHLARLRDAENALLAVIAQEPQNPTAHDQLARLYGLTARRYEAIPHVLELIRAGEETDLIRLIGRERGIIGDVEKLNRARRVLPDDPRPLIGLAWHAANEERHAEADALLQEAVRLGPELSSTWAARGRWLADRKQLDAWSEWIRICPQSAESDPSVWLARGEWADHQGDKPAALRCYWECVKRSPETRPALARFAQLLTENGDADSALRCQKYLDSLLALEEAQNRGLSLESPDSVDSAMALVDRYVGVGRLWEALALARLVAGVDSSRQDVIRRVHQIQSETTELPLTLTAPPYHPAKGLDFSTLPLPKPEIPGTKPAASAIDEAIPVSFSDISQEVGFEFRYDDGARGARLHMHEITGGGLGVIDYDVDGYADLFCSQAGNHAPPTACNLRDQLIRNRGGKSFVPCGQLAGFEESGFGQGVAVGDVNSDGFPDLFVGNIGRNALWINQGDGTFSESSAAAGLSGNVWTTSCLMADLNQDGHPDLYEANYLRGEKIFERTCTHPDGTVSQCMPFDFEGEVDRIWINTGDGHFEDGGKLLSREPDGKGLGVVAWRPAPDQQLCVYVANDTTPNFLWVPKEQSGHWAWNEVGLLSGVALSEDGKPQGSMGIAVGDIDQDLRPDLCVTNFLAESYAFYHADDSLSFRDVATESGLRDLTWNRLGFGAQLLDADGDGQLELFLANGHIQDLRRYGRPYRMPPLLCRYHQSKFREVPASTLGTYFQSEWLARASVTLDWNRDGRIDLVVGHLDDSTRILSNSSPQNIEALELHLTGRRGSRDAVGAIITVRAKGRTWTRQLVGGGGYQASNEPLIHWSATGIHQIDELQIDWPGGSVETFHDIKLPFQGRVVEGTSRLLECDKSE